MRDGVMMNSSDNESNVSFYCGSDYASLKVKAGKGKRLNTKQERKQVKALRTMRKNRHSL